jgi:hypothetical protein
VPKVSEAKQTEDYWIGFYDWLYSQDGFRKIKHWAEVYLKTEAPVSEAAEAPWTSTKLSVIEENYSRGMMLIDKVLAFVVQAYEAKGDTKKMYDVEHMTLDSCEEMNRVLEMARASEDFVMFDTHGREAIKSIIYHERDDVRLETLKTIRSVAKNAGFHIGEKRGRLGPFTSLYGRRVCSPQNF